MRRIGACEIGICAALLLWSGAAGAAGGSREGGAVRVVPGVFDGDTRLLATAPLWQPGTPLREAAPRRHTHAESPAPSPRHYGDPLLALQSRAGSGRARVYSPPELNFDGQGFSGVYPPDTNGEIGSNYYIQVINTGDGTGVVIHDKSTGAIVSGPFTLSSLWTAGGACDSGGGDPVILYDQLASRWLIGEFASTGNHLCLYLSRNNDPVSGGWLNYDFETPEFPDYPKFAVWPDAYTITTNESVPTVYALDRSRMLAGTAATMQSFTAPPLAGFGFQTLTPVDLDGTTAPPASSPSFFVRHVDDEVHLPAVPGSDKVEVWSLSLDFATPANSVFALADSVAVAEFDSEFCGGDAQCIAQPGGAVGLDPLREVVMWRAQYRNFGAYQTLVGNFVTDVSGSDQAGVRWFELRRAGMGAWALFQEGTYAPDSASRWMASIAMDGSGNMALGYSVSSSSVFPGIRYTGRLGASAAGVMDQGEVTMVSGLSSQSDLERWGDYSSMNVDPVDDCTFWYTNEYVAAGELWQTRIARFRYPAPTCVSPTPPSCGNGVREVGEDCDGPDADYCPGLCSGGCTCPAPTCGNGVVEVGEQCDGVSLGSCANGCTADCSCQLCATTPQPSAGCFLQFQPGKAVLSLSDAGDDTKDSLVWKWSRGEATSIGDFAVPTAPGPSYQVCIYDGSGASQPLRSLDVAGGGDCAGKPCWKASGSGYRYNNRDGNDDGVKSLQLKAGADGKALVSLKGRGAALLPPNPALTLPVTVQLLVDDGFAVKCWQTEFTAAQTNDDLKFKAKGP